MKQNRHFLNRNEQDKSLGELWQIIKTPILGQSFARSTDPETSEQAAERIRGEKANKCEQMVLEALRRHPHGLTSHDLVDATGLSWNTCTPRIRPLVRKGLVVDSGERREGCTNRKCVVWKAT